MVSDGDKERTERPRPRRRRPWKLERAKLIDVIRDAAKRFADRFRRGLRLGLDFAFLSRRASRVPLEPPACCGGSFFHLACGALRRCSTMGMRTAAQHGYTVAVSVDPTSERPDAMSLPRPEEAPSCSRRLCSPSPWGRFPSISLRTDTHNDRNRPHKSTSR